MLSWHKTLISWVCFLLIHHCRILTNNRDVYRISRFTQYKVQETTTLNLMIGMNKANKQETRSGNFCTEFLYIHLPFEHVLRQSWWNVLNHSMSHCFHCLRWTRRAESYVYYPDEPAFLNRSPEFNLHNYWGISSFSKILF